MAGELNAQINLIESFDPSDDQNLEELHLQKPLERAADKSRKDFDEFMADRPGEEPMASPADGAVDELGLGEDEGPGLIRKTGEGIVNAPGNMIGGFLEAIAEPFDTLRDISSGGNRRLMELGVPGIIRNGPDDFEFTTDFDKISESPDFGDLLPKVGDEEDQGSIVRGMTRFITGFATAGKMLKGIQGIQKVAQGSKVGANSVAAIKGAISDFGFMDEFQNPVNGLIEAFPDLEGPVTEFIAADEESSDLLNRSRNALIGVGLGALSDTVLSGLRIARQARVGRTAVQAAGNSIDNAFTRLQADNVVRREEFGRLLGDVDAPAFEIKANNGDASGEVFINWARIDSEDEVKEIIQALANDDSVAIKTSQRGVKTFADTTLDAEQLNAWEVLKSRAHGQGLNAEESLAARKLWASSAKHTISLAQEVTATGSEIAEIAFRKQLATHSAIQREVLGARTETARALSAWRIPAGDDIAFIGQMDTLLQQSDRQVPVRAIAEGMLTLNQMGRLDAVDTFMFGSPSMEKVTQLGVKGADMIRQFFYFSLLSRTTTHIRNFVGNTARIGLEIGDRKVANLFGQALGRENVPSGEAMSFAHGLVQGGKDSFRISSEGRQALKTAFRLSGEGDLSSAKGVLAENAEEFGGVFRSIATGDTGFGLNKVDIRDSGAFSSERLGFDPASNIGRAFDFLDTATAIPSRALGASDELFKAMNFSAERHALAFRKASDELAANKITQDGFDQRVAQIANDPDEAMRLLSQQLAESNTFTNRPRNSAFWTAFKSVGKVPVLGRFMLPFTRTPFNLAIDSFQRTPLAPLTKRFQEDIAAGGARADIAWSRFTTGNMILLGMADLAMSGDITGERRGISNRGAKRQQERRLGIQPMSIRIRNEDGSETYVPYRGFEPLSFPIGVAANIVELLSSEDFDDDNKEVDDLITASAIGIATQLSSSTYMRGISDFFNVMSDPTRYGEQYFEGLARTAIPGGVSQFVQGGGNVADPDPVVREVNGMMDAIIAQIPGMSDSLPARRDTWGKKLERDSDYPGVLGSIMPRTIKTEDIEPIDKELDRLEKFVGSPRKRATFDGVDINMNRFPEAFDRYGELQGSELKDPLGIGLQSGISPPEGYQPEGRGLVGELNAIVQGDHSFSSIYRLYGNGSQGGKSNAIQSIINYYRAVARVQIMEEFPEIGAEVFRRRGEVDKKFLFQEERGL